MNSLYKALGSGQPALDLQQAAPAPVGTPTPGAGTLFNAVAPQVAAPRQNDLAMGPMLADNSGLMRGNPFFRAGADDKQETAKRTNYQPQNDKQPEKDLATTATDFFNRMKK